MNEDPKAAPAEAPKIDAAEAQRILEKHRGIGEYTVASMQLGMRDKPLIGAWALRWR